jgi:quercetin dioxygenase-like cupin family protein
MFFKKNRMELKSIDATLNRPEGERLIDAPYVLVDLPKYVDQLKHEDSWDKSDRNSITVYKTDGITMVLTCLHKNATIEKNVVDGWLTVQVVDGAVDFTVKEKTLVLKKNQLITLHPDVEHTIHARKDTVLLLTNKTMRQSGSSLEETNDYYR